MSMGLFRKKNGSPNSSNSATPQPSVRTPCASDRGRSAAQSQGLPPQALGTLPGGKLSTSSPSSSNDAIGEYQSLNITGTKDLESLNLEKHHDGAAKRNRRKSRSELNLEATFASNAELAFSGIYSDRTHGHRGRPFDADHKLKPLNSSPTQTPQKLKPEHKSKVIDARGRLKWKDDEARKLNKRVIDAKPLPKPEKIRELPDFSRHWICTDVSGEWDEYLYLLGVPEPQCKLAKARNFGKGHEEQIINLSVDKSSITITNPFKVVTYTTSESAADKIKAHEDVSNTLTINGELQQLSYGGIMGSGVLSWEGESLVFRSKLNEEDVMIKRYFAPAEYGAVKMIVELRVAHVLAKRVYRPYKDIVG